MKFSMLGLLIGAAISVSACNKVEHSMTIEEEKKIESKVQEQVYALREAWGNLDPSAILSFYSEYSRDTYNDERVSIGEMRKWAATGYAGLISTEIGPFEEFRIDVLSPNAAVASWHNRVAEIYTGQSDATRYIAFMTQVWIREDNHWRILHNHESTKDLIKTD